MPIFLHELGELDIRGTSDICSLVTVESLRTFRFKRYDPDCWLCIEAIPCADKIESLDLEGVELISAEHFDFGHEFLKLLKMRLCRISNRIQSSLITPNLQDLTLIDIEPDWDYQNRSRPACKNLEKENVGSMLNGEDMLEGFTLKRLTLGSMLLDQSLPSKLRIQPALETLSIIDCNLTMHFLTWLANRDARSKDILPSLSRIHLTGCACLDKEYSLDKFVRDCAVSFPSVQVVIDP